MSSMVARFARSLQVVLLKKGDRSAAINVFDFFFTMMLIRVIRRRNCRVSFIHLQYVEFQGYVGESKTKFTKPRL